MIRYIYCRTCGDGWKLHPGDVQMGFEARTNYISSEIPKDHGITVNGAFTPLEHVFCDKCSDAVTGKVAVAITMWNTEREVEPLLWEQEYGGIVPPETVNAVDKLST